MSALSEPLLERGNTNCNCNSYRSVIRNTVIPFILTLICLFGLWIGYNIKDNDLSYDIYKPHWFKTVSYTGLSVATIVLCGWTFLLLALNLTEWCMIQRSKYYILPSTNKSYIFTTFILSAYLIALIAHSDEMATIIPGIFLYKFVGIESFYSISWIFGTCDHCLCCNMDCWFKSITVSCSIIILIIFIIFTIHFYDESESLIDMAIFGVAAIFFVVILIFVIILNFILWILFTHYTYSLYSLKVQYDRQILNKYTLKLIQKKMWRVAIYGVSVLIITISYIFRFAHYYFDLDPGISSDIYTFVNNISVLSLLTLVLLYERPSFHIVHPYTECTQCKSSYLSERCEICGEINQQLEPINPRHAHLQSINNQSPVSLVNISGPSMNCHDPTNSNVYTNCNGDNVSECEAFKRLFQISSKIEFIDSPKNEFMSKLNETYDDFTKLVNDYHHVINQHEPSNINNACECNEYVAARRSGKTSAKADVDEAYKIDMVFTIHGYLYHKIQPSRGFVADHKENKYDDDADEDKDDDDDDDDALVYDDSLSYMYDFGSFIHYQLLKSNKYATFKEEMVETGHINMDIWHLMYEIAVELEKSDKAKQCIKINHHYNILKTQQIQIADILAIKFYTDFDEEQRKFRESFRKMDYDTDKDVIKRHVNEYFFWGKWLNHAITVYGDRINNNGNITYYHGLSREFMFESLRKDFNIPTSTTTNISVAQRFAKNNGIVLQLKCQWDYNSDWNQAKALSVDWISQFPTEEEVLLFGNFNQLLIANVYLLNDFDHNNQHKLIIETINNFERLCNGSSLDDEYNDEQHDNMMETLIENEFNDESNNNYFAKLFHNICEERNDFEVTAFINYHRKSPNILQILENDNDTYCNDEKCNATMIEIDSICWKTINCVVCQGSALWYCPIHKSQYKLCQQCINMIRMLSQILQNGGHKIKINKYDAKKLEALRIELLQQQKLL